MSTKHNLHIPKGFLAGGIRAGIKSSSKRDLGMIYSPHPAIAAAVFTTNRFQAAPVTVCRKRLTFPGRHIRGVIVNSGNANAMTRAEGIKDATAMAVAAERATGSPAGSFLVASTGIIGKRLPLQCIVEGVPKLAASLSEIGWDDFAEAIMTTDLRKKISCRSVTLSNGKRCSILGITKGSGMIQPNLATMLAFIVTDFPLSKGEARIRLHSAVDQSFNCLTVDGQTSTNDMVLLMGSQSGAGRPSHSLKDSKSFENALTEVCQDLARAIALDGEGATKLVTIRVQGAKYRKYARTLALEVANSALVKTAIHGENPNWGRIVQALGQTKVPFSPDHVAVKIQKTPTLIGGLPCKFDRDALSKKMKSAEILIEIKMGNGPGSAEVWTCDFSKDYIRINAEYN